MLPILIPPAAIVQHISTVTSQEPALIRPGRIEKEMIEPDIDLPLCDFDVNFEISRDAFALPDDVGTHDLAASWLHDTDWKSG